MLPRCADTGCAIVTGAVESVDDNVLGRGSKGHTRADFIERRGLLGLGRDAGPHVRRVPPWTTLEGYCELLDTIEAAGARRAGVADSVAIRLLVPRGCASAGTAGRARAPSASSIRQTLAYPWTHPDPRVDHPPASRRGARRPGIRGRAAATSSSQIRAMAYRCATSSVGRPRACVPPRDGARIVPYLQRSPGIVEPSPMPKGRWPFYETAQSCYCATTTGTGTRDVR